MSRRTYRKIWAGAAALAVSAAVVVGVNVADASHSGSGTTLTTSNATRAIKFSNGSTLTVDVTVIDAAWAPDGSRAVFVDSAGGIQTVRFNEGRDVFPFVEPAPGVQRRHPTWRTGGSSVVWAERAANTAPWRLMRSPSAFGFEPTLLSPADGMHYTHPDGGPEGLVVFQRQANAGGTPTGTPDVWVFDPAGQTPEERTRQVIANGSHPAISPDGKKVAFVRSDGTRNQIFVSDLNGGGVVQVTSNAVAHDNPTWSPGGTTIAFNNNGATVATAPADGSGAANPTPVAGLSGLPAYEPSNRNLVGRLAGKTRFATAIAVSRSHWVDATDPDERRRAKSVVLSRSDDFADALSGGALAAAKEGPLLLTTPTALEPSTKDEIGRLLGDSPSSTVYLLGGTGAIAQSVEDELKATGVTVVRLAGPDRFATSVAIAKAITPSPKLVLAATGFDFPDALAAGAAAGSFNVPGVGSSAVVVLTANAVLTPAVKTYLDEVRAADPDAEIGGIGGNAALAVKPYPGSFGLVGDNRYETALLTAVNFFAGERFAGVATGSDWPDALAGGALMGTLNGPLMLTPTELPDLNLETAALLDSSCGSIDTALIFGGIGVVRSTVDAQVGRFISGPAGFEVKVGTDLGAAVKSRSDLAAVAKTRKAKERPSLAKLRSLAKGVMARHG